LSVAPRARARAAAGYIRARHTPLLLATLVAIFAAPRYDAMMPCRHDAYF